MPTYTRRIKRQSLIKLPWCLSPLVRSVKQVVRGLAMGCTVKQIIMHTAMFVVCWITGSQFLGDGNHVQRHILYGFRECIVVSILINNGRLLYYFRDCRLILLV